MKYSHNNLFSEYLQNKITSDCYIVHPEVQNAIAFARRNHPHANRSGEFVCAYLRLRARTCMRSSVRELQLKRIK